MRLLDFSNWETKTVGVRDVGPFEPPFERALCEIGEGWNCMDVGAAIGYYTIRMGQLVGEKGKIWAIEPHPLISAMLQRNVQSHDLTNVEVIQRAVCNGKRRIQLFETRSRGGTYARTRSLRPIARAKTGRWLESIFNGDIVDLARRFLTRKRRVFSVGAETLDNLIEGRVDLIKMDIQGMEFEALKGAKRILSRYKPLLLVEIHPSPYWRVEELYRLLQEHDYVFAVETIKGRKDVFLTGR